MLGHYFSAGAIPGPVVIAGALPAPLESSRPRGWNGIVVERYRTNDVDVVARSSAVLVTVHLGPPAGAGEPPFKRAGRYCSMRLPSIRPCCSPRTARGRGSLFVSHPRPRAMSATNTQDLKRFGKNTKDNLGSLSLSFDAVIH